MPLVEATPAQEQREDLIDFLAQRSSGLTRPRIVAIIDFVLDPERTITVNGIARAGLVQKGTARRYRDLLLGALENPNLARDPLASDHSLRPTDHALDNARTEAEAHAQTQRTDHNVNRKTLDSEDILEIIDRNIRRMDADTATPTATLKGMLDLKIKYQDLEAQRSENLQDPTKVLGPDGLAQLVPVLIQRFTLLMRHRHETPTFFYSAATMIMLALTEDLDAAMPDAEGKSPGLPWPTELESAIATFRGSSSSFAASSAAAAPQGEGIQSALALIHTGDVEWSLYEKDRVDAVAFGASPEAKAQGIFPTPGYADDFGSRVNANEINLAELDMEPGEMRGLPDGAINMEPTTVERETAPSVFSLPDPSETAFPGEEEPKEEGRA